MGVLAAYVNLGLVDQGHKLAPLARMSPPPLPSINVLRKTISEGIDTRLAVNPWFAITGYPKCGKTVAVANFVSQCNRRCLWFDFRPEHNAPGLSVHFLCAALSNELAASECSTAAVADSLIAEASREPILLVLANVEFVENPHCLDFLRHATERARNQLQIILLFAESPEFTGSLHLSGARSWRLPGMETHEAAELFSRSGVQITELRLKAIRLICAQCDGHVGMLKLLKPKIDWVTKSENLNSILSEAPKDNDVQNFLRALTERFVSGLSESELRLCNRMSIALGPICKELARKLWSVGGARSGFDRAWIRCASSFFETPDNKHFGLPYLYRSGLQKQMENDDVRLLNLLAAEHLVMPHGEVLNADDAMHGVYHFILAKEFERGAEQGARLLMHAKFFGHREIVDLLYHQFEAILAALVRKKRVSPFASVRVLVSFSDACLDINMNEQASAYAEELEQLLTKGTTEIEDSSPALGYFTLLRRAAPTGEPELALRSLDGFLQSIAEVPDRKELPSLIPLVFGAFSQSNGDAQLFVGAMLDRIEQKRLTIQDLWPEVDGNGDWYSLWYLVSRLAYHNCLAQEDPNSGFSEDVAARLWDLSVRMREVGHPCPAAIIGAMAIELEIDFNRNLDRAMTRSDELVSHPIPDDKRVRSRVLNVRADALRCNERSEDAVNEYLLAIDAWPDKNTHELAVMHATLGITFGKFEKYDKAIDSFRLAVLDLKGSEDFDPSELARYWLEACVAAIKDQQFKRGLACLILAHRALVREPQNSKMPVVVAQLATEFGACASGEKDRPNLVCGFTLGLPSTIPGAADMELSASDVMLSRACAALGQHFRALQYAQHAYFKLRRDDLRAALCVSLFSDALATKHLPTICRAAMLGPLVDTTEAQTVGDIPWAKWLDGFVLNKTISCIGSSIQDKSIVLAGVEDALADLDTQENPYAGLLVDVIGACRNARFEGDDPQIDVVLRKCIETNCPTAALAVAGV